MRVRGRGVGRERDGASPAREGKRAVSPVIGVILMVAITVILAAVVGTFVLDTGNRVTQDPTVASLTLEDAGANYDTADVTTGSVEDFIVISHEGGDEIDASDLRIIVRNESNGIVLIWEAGSFSTNNTDGENETVLLNADPLTASDTIVVGDVLTIRVDDDPTSGPAAPDGGEFEVYLVDTEADNTIARSTVEVE